MPSKFEIELDIDGIRLSVQAVPRQPVKLIVGSVTVTLDLEQVQAIRRALLAGHEFAKDED